MTTKYFFSILTAAFFLSNPLAAQHWAWEMSGNDKKEKFLVLSEGLATDAFPYPIFVCRKQERLVIELALNETLTSAVTEILQTEIYPYVLLDAKSIKTKAIFFRLTFTEIHGWIMEMETSSKDPIWGDVAENGILRMQIGSLNKPLIQPGFGEKLFLPFMNECSG
jgi:hypothetical protein